MPQPTMPIFITRPSHAQSSIRDRANVPHRWKLSEYHPRVELSRDVIRRRSHRSLAPSAHLHRPRSRSNVDVADPWAHDRSVCRRPVSIEGDEFSRVNTSNAFGPGRTVGKGWNASRRISRQVDRLFECPTRWTL